MDLQFEQQIHKQLLREGRMLVARGVNMPTTPSLPAHKDDREGGGLPSHKGLPRGWRTHRAETPIWPHIHRGLTTCRGHGLPSDLMDHRELKRKWDTQRQGPRAQGLQGTAEKMRRGHGDLQPYTPPFPSSQTELPRALARHPYIKSRKMATHLPFLPPFLYC